MQNYNNYLIKQIIFRTFAPVKRNFAYYSLPFADSYYEVSGNEVKILPSYSEVGNESGYVIAPFAATPDSPIAMIPQTDAEEHPLPLADDVPDGGTCPFTEPDEAYRTAFTRVHAAIASGECQKIVLSRCQKVSVDSVDAFKLFVKTCRKYPQMMVQLFSTPHTGTWLTATPEVLIEGKDDAFRTMALAGTMPFSEHLGTWSDKNRNEQHIVEHYIEETLAPFAASLTKNGPYTSHAGHLVHLRTDFHFQLTDGKTIGDIVSHLHPTPAVCGIPTDKARDILQSVESHKRRYYSGFAGPVGVNGETHLYVSLRCIELISNPITTGMLYAGGGIMPDSTCISEWNETEQKMQTIHSVLMKN